MGWEGHHKGMTPCPCRGLTAAASFSTWRQSVTVLVTVLVAMINGLTRASKMAQCGEVLAAKSDILSSILRNSTVDGENANHDTHTHIFFFLMFF